MIASKFDAWEGEYLEYSGIKGMHWGVRRYQNEDGTLTALGKERYGSGAGDSKASAKRMTKDFNRLDEGYAKVVGKQRYNAQKTAKLSRKMHAAERRGNEKKAAKLKEKAMKSANKAALNNKQLKAIEKLQWKIIGNAAAKGYTTRSTPVVRLAKSGSFLAEKTLKVSGQNVNITRRGPGGTQITNYSGYKQTAQRLRNEDEARKRQNYYNR